MDFDVRPVSLDQIETTDQTFKISTTTDKTELALSISAIGLLQPPVLIENGPRFTIVCGFRRIDACDKLRFPNLPARILDPDCSSIECVQIAIADNTFQRPLNVVEQSRAFALIQQFADPSASWIRIAETVGLPASPAAMDRIMPVAQMPPALRESILSGRLALPVALQINRLPTADTMALGNFFDTITTGLNVQRELLDLIVDISRRDGVSVAGLVQQDDVVGILTDEATAAPQKIQLLRQLLKMKRFPTLSQAEANYRQMLKSVRLDTRVQIQPPRFFEGKSYRVTMTVESRRQLKTLQLELDKLANHPHLLPE